MNLLQPFQSRQLRAGGAAVLLIGIAVSCTTPVIKTESTPTSPPAGASLSTPKASAPRDSAIRFALVGDVTTVNVWSLFDTNGYSYDNYAVRSGYWPRLYRLSIPGRQLEPLAARTLPPAVVPEGNFYTGTIPIRSDLTWTDGSPFTADDIVFTVNTVLSFHLGFDWQDHYNPDFLDHAEAVDAHTVKFYFKKMPDVGVWQYGVLQGPVLQKKYWDPRTAGAVALLPSADLLSQIEALKIKVSGLQQRVEAIQASLVGMTGDEARKTQAGLQHQQSDLDQSINDLSKVQVVSDNALTAARTMLYALDDANEPHLGSWNFKTSANGTIENDVNAGFVPGRPYMDRTIYRFYPSEAAAVTAFLNGEVDAALLPGGLSQQAVSGNPALHTIMRSPSHSLRFLVFNPLFSTLNDPAIHQAFSCVIDPQELAGQLKGQAAPLESFVLPAEVGWSNPAAGLPCKGLDGAARIQQAVQILKSAGFTWKKEPAANAPGRGLTLPDGEAFPNVNLIVSSEDDERVAAAAYVRQQAQMLGIPLTVGDISSIDLNYAVLGSQNYEMALLGWHVSSYPGYLCDWFGGGNQFQYAEPRITSLCDNLQATSDLENARQQVFNIQSILAQDLPFIPLYSGLAVDVYRNIKYPFDQVLDGLSGVFGAPDLAIPVNQ